jgi:hypothetical protein
MKDCPKYVAEGGNIHAEIEYMKDTEIYVHSDICPAGCSMTGINSTVGHSVTYEYMLITALKEWLRESNGTGYFYIGNWDDIAEAFGNALCEIETGVELHG